MLGFPASEDLDVLLGDVSHYQLEKDLTYFERIAPQLVADSAPGLVYCERSEASGMFGAYSARIRRVVHTMSSGRRNGSNCRADSTGRCNGLMKSFCWRIEA
jgi:hypothetical protein